MREVEADDSSVQYRSVASPLTVFVAGAAIGVLGGLIGLGGAEFRLPLLIGLFGFAALQAVILNKAMSLVVVATALPARLVSVPWADVIPHWSVALNILSGSIVGAWLGASWATRMRSATFYRVLAGLLILIAAVLVATHIGTIPKLNLPTAVQIYAGLIAGVAIGVVAALMGVAGGELIIPTIVLLYAIDIKIAGTLCRECIGLSVLSKACGCPRPSCPPQSASDTGGQRG